MDRGDNGFILHESFKDLKTRRAEQEAYRKALEEQIMQKRKLQEREREKFEGRRAQIEPLPSHVPQRIVSPSAFLTPNFIQPPEAYSNESLSCCFSNAGTPKTTERPTSKGMSVAFNETDNFNESKPTVAVAAIMANEPEKSARGTSVTTTAGVPQFSPECMKYLQQVMPGFTLPPPLPTPKDYNDSMNQSTLPSVGQATNQTPHCNGLYETQHGVGEDANHNGAFSSSGTTSESSSMEDVSTHAKIKVHVSQTSEQMEGVKVSRKQYREELQQQIDERKRRDEEQRRKAEEEEEKIQEKIRIEQEKMQKEYEEELRKQEEREKEKEAEQKRLATLAKQREIAKAKAKEEAKRKKEASLKENNDVVVGGTGANSNVIASSSASEESIESIGEFFDETTMTQGQGSKIVNPDDRIIPVVAKRLREKVLQKKSSEEHPPDRIGQDLSLTARIDSTFQDFPLPITENDGPPPPQPGLIREMAIRSAPCPSTLNSTDLDFLASLKHYLQNEKSKIDERKVARASKSTERF